jgi:hypothetical protein
MNKKDMLKLFIAGVLMWSVAKNVGLVNKKVG